jgi:hypothetical protein
MMVRVRRRVKSAEGGGGGAIFNLFVSPLQDGLSVGLGLEEREAILRHQEENEHPLHPSPIFARVDLCSYDWADTSSDKGVQGEQGRHGRPLAGRKDICTRPRPDCQYWPSKCPGKESQDDNCPDVWHKAGTKGKERRDGDIYLYISILVD